MILHNVRSTRGDHFTHIHIKNGSITTLTNDDTTLKVFPGETELELNGALVFPGLINSHEHLDFNLFRQTGNRIYANYREWAKDINDHNKSEIDAVLKVPQPLRTLYGIYKNLLNGFTTVVNHGEHLAITGDLVNVLQDTYSLHSVYFENNWKYKLNRLFKKKGAFVIHVGEGTDKVSADEINKLAKWNIFKRKLIAVHGVAMNEVQAAQFHAVVWCPASNFFLLNSTAPVDILKKHTHIIFGTDSTLTSPWNIWQQLRQARATNLLTDEELMEALTGTPATVWELNSGTIAENRPADIVVARRKNGSTEMDAFYAIEPEDILLVLHNGNIRLFDESLCGQLTSAQFPLGNFKRIAIGESSKFVEGDLPGLIESIKTYLPSFSFP